MNQKTSKPNVQGEGDYDSAEKYNKGAHEFAESGKVDAAAQAAAPRNAQEKDAMREAEAEGRSHAKGQADAGKDKPGQPAPEKNAPAGDPKDGKPAPEKFPGR